MIRVGRLIVEIWLAPSPSDTPWRVRIKKHPDDPGVTHQVHGVEIDGVPFHTMFNPRPAKGEPVGHLRITGDTHPAMPRAIECLIEDRPNGSFAKIRPSTSRTA